MTEKFLKKRICWKYKFNFISFTYKQLTSVYPGTRYFGPIAGPKFSMQMILEKDKHKQIYFSFPHYTNLYHLNQVSRGKKWVAARKEHLQ